MSSDKSLMSFRVVCLGGSAGGLEAYLEILRSLPADSGMAFVVVSHRGLGNEDRLCWLLARATAMPVAEVEQGMSLEPNRVFIMPAGKDMTLHSDIFDLKATPRRRGFSKALTLFLRSLSEAYGSRGVAVILSGMDGDGSAALAAFKAAGGVTFAQANPAFASMPDHAVATGHVDFVLPPAEIAQALLSLPGVRD